MEAATTESPPVLHPRALAFTVEARGIERRIGLLFCATGVVLIAGMGVLGLIMRLTQATVISLSPAWFYRLLTLHGVGMITGALLAMMGALWYVLHASVPLRTGRMLATYALTIAGVLAVLVATLVGGFGAGWTFLPPLPFYPAGQWSVWSESLFFVGNLLVGAGFCVFCIDVLEQTTNTYGGLARTLGWHYLRGREEKAPPPQAIAATVVAIDGLISCAVGSTILLGLLGRTYDHTVGIDALVAKNLVYFFGHSIANLTIYLAAAVVYVLVPRYAGRPYETTKVFVAGWMGSLDLHRHRLLAPSLHGLRPTGLGGHHLRGRLLRRVDPGRGDHDLLDDDAHLGLSLPVDARLDAALHRLRRLGDRRRRSGDRLDHPDQLPPPQHDLGRCPLPHLSDSLRGRLGGRVSRSPARARRRPYLVTGRYCAWTVALILVGGYGLTGTWFVEGALGIPRRYAIQPPGTSGYSIVGASFALLLALGFLSLFIQLVPLARSAWERRHVYPLVEHMDSWTGTHYQTRVTSAESGAALEELVPSAEAFRLRVTPSSASESPRASSLSPRSSRRSSTPQR